jgi:hypothetical protein
VKVEICEHDACFSIDLTAESVADAAILARMSMNRTTELRSCEADAFKDGVFGGYIVIGKRKNDKSWIKGHGI